MTSLAECPLSDVSIMVTYVETVFTENNVPAYKDFTAATRAAKEVLKQPHLDAEVFHALLDRILHTPDDVKVIYTISSRTLTAALEHPDCPPEYLRRALYSVVPEYRVAAFHNTSTPEDALIAYWLAMESAS